MGVNSGSLINLKKVGTQDKDLQKVQQNVENTIEPIIRKEIVDGVLLKKVCLEPGVSNEVKHSLGRKPLGWIVVRKRADARIWDVQDFNNNPSKTLSIACSHSVTVDLWIF
jgi:hypothetical protein